MADGVTFTFDNKRFSDVVSRFLDITDQDTVATLSFISLRVHSRILGRTAVGATGRLQRGWKTPVRFEELAFKITTDVPYAPTLEYGAYPGVGPKTIALGTKRFGFGITVGSGIFSSQSPHGMVRRSLAEEATQLVGEIKETHQRRWGNV